MNEARDLLDVPDERKELGSEDLDCDRHQLDIEDDTHTTYCGALSWPGSRPCSDAGVGRRSCAQDTQQNRASAYAREYTEHSIRDKTLGASQWRVPTPNTRDLCFE